MNIYTIKVALRGISPMVWRRLRIPGNTSLAQFHKIIQLAFNWDDEHLHQFHIYGKDYGINYIGAVMYSDDAHKVLIDDFNFDAGDKFTYEYNFFIDNVVDIRIEKIIKPEKRLHVFCIKGYGMPGANENDDIELTLELLKRIAFAKDEIDMNDINPLIDEITSSRFFRVLLNRRFQSELAENI